MQPRSEHPRNQTKPHVLLVVRRSRERQQVSEELERAGLHVISTDDCHDALLCCLRTRVLDALITETELPAMWGVELARRASQCHAHLAVICICNDPVREHTKHEIEARGWEWVQKESARPDVLVSRLLSRLAPGAELSGPGGA